MNAREFKEIYGPGRCEEVALEAGTNYEYFRQLASGHRRCSPELAEELERASGGEMKFRDLLLKE